jgi:predicted Zn finger-like uncharacterized protein
MPISISCPGCHAEFRLADALSGKRVRCSKCATILQVPHLASPEEPAPQKAQDVPSLSQEAVQDALRVPTSPAAAPFLSPSPLLDDEPPRVRKAASRPVVAGRSARKTPTFVWLVPVLFALLFLMLGGVGAVVMNANPRDQFRPVGGWNKPVGMAPKVAWEKKEEIWEKPVLDKPVWDKPMEAKKGEGKVDMNLPAVFAVLPEPDAGGAATRGSLQLSDPIDRFRGDSYCKVYQVRLTANRTYTIDMRRQAPDIDPYLRLVDANGINLSADDDSGGDRDARIVFTPRVTGDYRIVATTFRRATGSFTLSVRSGANDQKGFEAKKD